MFRLVRGTRYVLDVLPYDRFALGIHDGAFSAMDPTTRPLRIPGELRRRPAPHGPQRSASVAGTASPSWPRRKWSGSWRVV
ncbi:hypothetical protein GCM10023084_72290 [Streptomyces lacrimifluminis]|uniref:Uncharacterized protein n=1 Tax=Streptomyces lacrimifluminis TaxID=1500077 RepID=A0A917P5R8_9ACTN|nr:hypothetical protein [Streptomyces lacrimifluminis]GGJ63049.1 hypothetical protein GCM10012282_70370 [Streptomyces lacrimifluminis]